MDGVLLLVAVGDDLDDVDDQVRQHDISLVINRLVVLVVHGRVHQWVRTHEVQHRVCN